MALCNEEVSRLSGSFLGELDNDMDSVGDAQDGEKKETDLFKLVSLQSRNYNPGTIVIEQDLKLLLLRHWSLFQSICNSNFVVSKLKLWKEPG